MFKSFNPTAVLPESARSVTVVIAIPVPKAIPVGKLTFAAPSPGITKVKYMLAPAVGVPAVLLNATFLAEGFELYIYHPVSSPADAFMFVAFEPDADTK